MGFASLCFTRIWPILCKLLNLWRCCNILLSFNVCRICSDITSFIAGIGDLSSPFFPLVSLARRSSILFTLSLSLNFQTQLPVFCVLKLFDFPASFVTLRIFDFCKTPLLFQFSFLLSLIAHFHLSIFCPRPLFFHFKISPATRQSPLFSWSHSWKYLYFQLSLVHLMLLFLLWPNESTISPKPWVIINPLLSFTSPSK